MAGYGASRDRAPELLPRTIAGIEHGSTCRAWQAPPDRCAVWCGSGNRGIDCSAYDDVKCYEGNNDNGYTNVDTCDILQTRRCVSGCAGIDKKTRTTDTENTMIETNDCIKLICIGIIVSIAVQYITRRMMK